jgi:hypothetical protein
MSAKEEVIELYMHEYQEYFCAHNAQIKCLIAGRGWGKTTSDGYIAYRCVVELPRSRGYFVGATYTQIITKFLPAIMDVWDRMGVTEYDPETKQGDYVVGLKPPRHFKKPYVKVKKYTNLISFRNGSYIEMLSMDRPDLNLGGSYDWGIVDEVQNINEFKLNKDYIVATRGNSFRYNSPLHHTIILNGTRPWTLSGQWIYKYKELANSNPDKYLFLERTSFDNKEALGQNYFDTQKEILSEVMYQVEILNKKVEILSDGFYPNFSEDRHTYLSSYHYDNEIVGGRASLTEFRPASSDYDPSLPLEISFDFGANVTCMLIAQEHKNELRFIDMFHASRSSSAIVPSADEPKQLLQRVVAQFVNKYGKHPNKVMIWGDYSGHNKSDRAPSSYEVVEGLFQKAKINYINKVEKTTNPKHAKKYFVINDILEKTVDLVPAIKINKSTCGELILSIQISPVDDDFSKDKRSERDTNLPPSMQTHYSDAFDYILWGKYHHRFNYGSRGVYYRPVRRK